LCPFILPPSVRCRSGAYVRRETTVIRRCPEHGYFASEDGDGRCDCGDEGRAVLGEERRVRLSKFTSGALRHFPDDAGITLDENGWTDHDALVGAVVSRYGWARPEHVDAVVATDPKGRFESDGGRIRAAYGHSVDVTLEDGVGGAETDVPDTLYHGTARRNVSDIQGEGIVPKGRQEVYLSRTTKEARDVGARHGEPVVFEVDTENLDVERRGDTVYAVDEVPPECISLV
jgi:putative RNA 2'-phosphotransferase